MLLGLVCWFVFMNQVIAKKCDTRDLVQVQCEDTQVCDENTGTCKCKPGFQVLNDSMCIDLKFKSSTIATPNTSSFKTSPSNGSIVATVAVTLVLVMFIICALYLSRKYKLVHWCRRKIHRRTNSYNEFAFGDDLEDVPPLH